MADGDYGGRSGRFERLLRPRPAGAATDRRALRHMAWSGVPDAHRPDAWRVLLDYLPADPSRRPEALRRGRTEYAAMVLWAYGLSEGSGGGGEAAAAAAAGAASASCPVLRQVRRDVPRTMPDLALFRDLRVQKRLERILYVWARGHPGTSYAQGMNDLAVPFFVVFLKGHRAFDGNAGGDARGSPPTARAWAEQGGSGGTLEGASDDVFDAAEADTYWCLERLLSGIQDHFAPDQPGIHRNVARLEDLLQRVDPNLWDHLRWTGVEALHFAFRWMNCLLVRELPLPSAIRLFDAYLSEGADEFDDFHVYVCVALLHQLGPRLRAMDHDGAMEFLTHLPPEEIGRSALEVTLSQAYVWHSTFKGSQGHLGCSGRGQQVERRSVRAVSIKADGFSPGGLTETSYALAESYSPTSLMSDVDFLCY